ncbi:MAG: hypothetical protein FVQ81_18765, partial [Candidatus Glassbacteria bacterium]|nr:hypothetical protein [Candidatus Glassbacteria bacterium]
MPEDPIPPEAIQSDEFSWLGSEIFPITSYSPETRLGLGVATWLIGEEAAGDSLGQPDSLWASAMVTQEKQYHLWVIPEVFLLRDRYRIKANLEYLKFPTLFYGIGNDTVPEAEENYTPIIWRVETEFTLNTAGGWRLGPILAFERTAIVETEPGGSLGSGGANGAPGAQGSEVTGFGMTVRFDWREHPFGPREGGLIALSLLRFRGSAPDTQFEYLQYKADLRWFFPLAEGHVLGFQSLWQHISGNAPFTSLPKLGGKLMFRGMYEGRYRDHALLAFQSEYRFP